MVTDATGEAVLGTLGQARARIKINLLDAGIYRRHGAGSS
jgi:hypothetical protein